MESMNIKQKLDEFVNELEALIRDQVLNAVAQGLGGVSASAPKHANGTNGKAHVQARAQSSSFGQKRDPKVIAATVSKVAAFVKAHPGSSIEAIGTGLAMPTKDLTLPIAKLLRSKTIGKKGVKRATKYYPKG